MKKVYTSHLAALFFANLLALSLSAQQPVRRCGTVEYNRQREQQNPAVAESRQRANQLIEQYVSEHSSEGTRSVITIPVVVHVLYKYNIQNISDEQIHSQIDVLNKDFARLNADTNLTPAAFSSVAVNTG